MNRAAPCGRACSSSVSSVVKVNLILEVQQGKRSVLVLFRCGQYKDLSDTSSKRLILRSAW